jgi:hypothetical protein
VHDFHGLDLEMDGATRSDAHDEMQTLCGLRNAWPFATTVPTLRMTATASSLFLWGSPGM